MEEIRLLKSYLFVGGVCDKTIYPVTSTSAVLCKDADGNAIEGVEENLESRLQAIEIRLTKIEALIDSLLYAVVTSELIAELTGLETETNNK